MMETLADERCGLYFLAGVDKTAARQTAGIVTVHAAQGALTREHKHFIENAFATLHPDYVLRLRFHSDADLHSPDSLESFARCFQHDRILSDPTGAFDRVSKLLELAGQVRADLGPAVGSILWRADLSELVVLTAPFSADPARHESLDGLQEDVVSLVESRAPTNLRKAIRSVKVSTEVPSGRYTPIDAASLPAAPAEKSSFTSIFARLSGIAALIGLGTMSAAGASAPATLEDDRSLTPGITGLIGLTTLGENSYGLRNHYQAVGGLRLYFGGNGALVAPSVMPNPVCTEGCETNDESVTDGPQHTDPTMPAPTRVAYGT